MTPEVVREAGIYDFRVASKQRVLHVRLRLLGIAAGPAGVLLGWKVDFEDRLQHQHRCCHAHPISQGLDAQRPELGVLRRRVGFRYEHSSDHDTAQFAVADPDDVHVLEAALACHADCIATANLKDFPVEVVSPLGIQVTQPDR